MAPFADRLANVVDLCAGLCPAAPPLDGLLRRRADVGTTFEFASQCAGVGASVSSGHPGVDRVRLRHLPLVQNADGSSVSYCFDRQDRLIGKSMLAGPGTEAAQLGAACVPQGPDANVLCTR